MIRTDLPPARRGRLGGRTRDEKPRAILLRSGDVVVMGRASRLLYHGIPRILADTLPPSIARLPGSLLSGAYLRVCNNCHGKV